MRIKRGQKGWVYVLRNPAMPNIYKVGMTRRTKLDARVSELSNSTSAPLPFQIVFAYNTPYPYDIEQSVHERLKKYRINKKREFFKCSIRKIKREIRSCDPHPSTSTKIRCILSNVPIWIVIFICLFILKEGTNQG
jgi:hypothetical protein